ncbi:MAG: hypothetical protein ACKOTE_18495 [Opitutaceae bacterium]
MRWLVFLLLVPWVALRGAESAAGFLHSLTPEQRMRLGLATLTPAQAAELEAAVEAYARGRGAPATEAKKPQVTFPSAPSSEPAPVAAVPVKTPPAVSAAPPARKSAPAAAARSQDAGERFTARVIGPVRGWSGGTYFPLENGEVWRQVGTESNELPVRQNAEVEIYPSRNGYWRLSFEGAWITVRRLQ